ncbi:MAG: Fur family transcriptional regulator [Solirubrobacteraceae bacterium]
MQSASASEWAEHARAVLDQAGHRKGGARNAIIDLLAEQSCALSALEIEDRLRAGKRSVARASIYRVLDLLQDCRLVARLELGDAMTRYEPIDPAGAHHHHLLCDSCGRLVPFDDGDLERSIDRLSRRLGFDTHEHEVVLRGDCSACKT